MIDWDGLVVGPLQAVFGQPVTYQPVIGAAFTVSGVFDVANEDLTLVDTSTPVNTRHPVLGVRAADFAVAPQQGDTLIIQATGVRYVVRDTKDDSHGSVRLSLNRMSP